MCHNPVTYRLHLSGGWHRRDERQAIYDYQRTGHRMDPAAKLPPDVNDTITVNKARAGNRL